MKTIHILTVLSVLIFSVSIFAGDNMLKNDKDGIEQAITNYVKSVDSRNTDELSKTLMSSGSVITVNNITNKLDHYSGNQFINMVKNGQKGGWVRNVAVNSVETEGNTATAKVAITDARLKQIGFITLVKDNGNWKVASEVTTLELNK
jgi:hypothetical protein